MIRVLGAVLALVLLTACDDRPGQPPAPAPTTSTAASPSPSESASALPTGAPETAADTTERIVAAERAIADPSTRGEALAEAGRTQQVAYRTWSDHPEWDAAVRRGLPADLRPVAAANVAARRALRSIYPTSDSDLPDELPAWHVERPDPLGELVAAYHEAQRRTGVGWSTLAAINFVESDFGRINGDSDAGAQGPMQFIPSTWDIYGRGGDIHDPRDAILAAGRLLEANGFADAPVEALHHYNNSDGYVRAVTILARLIDQRPRALAGYHQWQVYYLTDRGPVLLPEGYQEARPVPVDRWLAHHPQGG